MKFVAETLARCKPRLGALKEIEALPGMQVETPCAMLYTRVSTNCLLLHYDCFMCFFFREEVYHTLLMKCLSWSASSLRFSKFLSKALTTLKAP